jgi:hypothetical protein
MGKPHDLSPKAYFKSWTGYGFPFDRHDWFVDRGGKEVRYVIDYYFNPDSGADVAGGPVGSGDNVLVPTMTKSIHVDVRPAVDDFTSIVDRLKRFPERLMQSFSVPKFYGEGIDPSKAPKEAAAFALHSSDNIPKDPVKAQPSSPFDSMDARCKPALEKFKAADSVTDKQAAYVELNCCLAKLVCPNEAKSFLDILEKGGHPTEEEAKFHAMSKCVLDQLMTQRATASAAGGKQLK